VTAIPAMPGYEAYMRARDAVRQMKAAAAAGSASPSAYWADELDNIDYMIEASPLIVRKLRHHAFHVTGIRPYDYRDKHDGRREHFEARLDALRAIAGDDLLVPESPALGGYGYDVRGRLFNVDTIKFFEVLIGMERGGVLRTLRGIDRPVVCEIGAGWGGFAYQFKTLFPRSTYVIVDFAELFLFSATYLGTVFPDARIVFAGADDAGAIEGWRDADFVFVPHTHSRLVSALPLDLTVNMVSFQEMTDTQVRAYAAMAASAKCPLLYSMNRERSPYNSELLSVSDALSDFYALTEVAVLDTDYTSAFRKPSKTPRVIDPAEPRYRHLVGQLKAPMATTRGAASKPAKAGEPRVVLGMTLYNNAKHLPHAVESLLAQSYGDFALLLLDDASTDDTEGIARGYAARDPRVTYLRHDARQAMIATWREVAETAASRWPSAEYFAWVSDHDWWHPRWLERLIVELDQDAGAVLAYPVTQRVSIGGAEIGKEPRLFDTAARTDVRARWRHLCRHLVGAGDMVYGLMRMDALRRAGIFRPVLRPDRLLVAELTLHGRIRQVPEVLWYRRQSQNASVDKQATTLLLAGTEPPTFSWPPWLQHADVLWREYATRGDGLGLSRAQWLRMLAHYQLRYGWRHFRKTGSSHAVGRAFDSLTHGRKLAKHHILHAVYHTLVGSRVVLGKARRLLWR
jgi:glycosyltransferase involved in cell wall biosynthesis